MDKSYRNYLPVALYFNEKIKDVQNIRQSDIPYVLISSFNTNMILCAEGTLYYTGLGDKNCLAEKILGVVVCGDAYLANSRLYLEKIRSSFDPGYITYYSLESDTHSLQKNNFMSQYLKSRQEINSTYNIPKRWFEDPEELSHYLSDL